MVRAVVLRLDSQCTWVVFFSDICVAFYACGVAVLSWKCLCFVFSQLAGLWSSRQLSLLVACIMGRASRADASGGGDGDRSRGRPRRGCDVAGSASGIRRGCDAGRRQRSRTRSAARSSADNNSHVSPTEPASPSSPPSPSNPRAHLSLLAAAAALPSDAPAGVAGGKSAGCRDACRSYCAEEDRPDSSQEVPPGQSTPVGLPRSQMEAGLSVLARQGAVRGVSAAAEGQGGKAPASDEVASSSSAAAERSAGVIMKSLIKRAAALRLKYRRVGGKVRLAVALVGFHPANRDGTPPNGERCKRICTDVLQIGFDEVEANHEGVCVAEEVGSSRTHAYNVASCSRDVLLADVSAGADMICFGSLSHSHLHQVLRNVDAGVTLHVDGICTPDGKLSLALLGQADSAFAEAVIGGLLWEILEPAMMVEEPAGAEVIQAALNAKNGICMVSHEMQCISRLVLASEAGLAFEVCREQLFSVMPEFVGHENFPDLFRFVLELGGNRAPFLAELREFHATWVDPSMRRLRLGVFAVFAGLPLEFAHLKVAGIKYCYSSDRVQDGYCIVPAKSVITSALGGDFGSSARVGENVLRFFHVTCRNVILAKVVLHSQIKFMANVDRDVFGAVLGVIGTGNMASCDVRENNVIDKGFSQYNRLVKLCHPMTLPAFPWADKAGGSSAAAEGSAEALPFQPQVIRYDDSGNAVNPAANVQKMESVPLERFAWRQMLSSSLVEEQMQLQLMRSTVFAALATLRCRLQPRHSAVCLQRGGREKTGLNVFAAVAAGPGDLCLLPGVIDMGRIVKFDNQEVVASISSGSTVIGKVGIVGSCSVPNARVANREKPLATVPGVADFFKCGGLPEGSCPDGIPATTAAAVMDHEWKVSHFPEPLWAVQRSVNSKIINMEWASMSCNIIASSTPVTPTVAENTREHRVPNVAVPLTQTWNVVIPVLTNAQAVSAGEELVTYKSQSIGKVKDRKQKDWVDDIKKDLKKKTKAA